jgi:hypothetical protein
MSRSEQVPGERLVVNLVNGPRAKVDLIEFRGAKEDERYFFIRKMVFKAPGNVDGFEIKLSLEVAALLRVSLKKELEGDGDAKQPAGTDPQAQDNRPHAVRSASA